jgi:transglutaminase-like putative cysteine protease
LWKGPNSEIGQISARTYLKSGNKVSVKSEHVLKQKSGDATLWEFALPQFKEHCIIEVKYWKAHEGWFGGTEWMFGGRHPTKVSRLRLLFPDWVAELDASQWTQGYVTRRAVPKPKFDREHTTDGEVVSFTWELVDLPGVKEEHFMPPIRDVVPTVKIGATQKGLSWDKAGQWYFAKYLKERLEPGTKTREVAQNLAAGRNSKESRLRAVYDYVRKSIRYTDIPLTESGICPNYPDVVLRNAHGDCKDQATLMVALARAMGLPAKCALVRTKDWGRVEDRITDRASD